MVRCSTGMRIVGVDGLTVLILELHASRRSEPPKKHSYSQPLGRDLITNPADWTEEDLQDP